MITSYFYINVTEIHGETTGHPRVAYINKRAPKTYMNPHNPTTTDMQDTADIFFAQMKRLSQRAADPRAAWQQSFDLQMSDRWC